MTSSEYQTFLFGALDKVKTQILIPNVGSSRIKTRYITSEGSDDEQWIGKLRDENNVTDIWMVTAQMVIGRTEEQRQVDPVGTFTKPLTLMLDFFYDYKQGTDDSNSEKEFLEKVFAVDFALENKRGCLQDNIRINGWGFRLGIKRFVNSSAHFASGILNLEIQDIAL